MINLVDTERLPQQPLDKAASSILTDRSLPFRRASWQQCSHCSTWTSDEELEYIFQCVLGSTPTGASTISFELKTRYPAYTCQSCCEAPSSPQLARADGSDDLSSDEEHEQLCPLHVQAVYLVQGNNAASNMTSITKGYVVHCPDCGLMSSVTSSQQQVKAYIEQHVSSSTSCSALSKALAAHAYDSPAAFGGIVGSTSAVPEKVIKELLSRLVVMTACHIVSCTRPPPTPVEQLLGAARAAAMATAGLKTRGVGSATFRGQQLMPYRRWAVDALSLDSDLLAEANWVRPSLAGIDLEHKPSLLDMVLAPPYIAVAEHDAGMTVDKLAVLLLREQQRQMYGSLVSLAAAAAAGERLSAAVAATETSLANLLATDSVFQHYPAEDRVQQFLEMAGIPGIGDVVCALAQPYVHARSARYLNVCAVCGMSPAALKRAKRTYGLHRCKHCIICTCQSCKQEQQRLQPPPVSPEAAIAADQLCLWCQGHPDAQMMQVPGRGRLKQSQSASADESAHLALAATARAAKGHSAGEASVPAATGDGGRFNAFRPFVSGVQPAVVSSLVHDEGEDGCDSGIDTGWLGRPAHQYDLAVRLATAAAAAAGAGQPSQLTQLQPVAGSGQEQLAQPEGGEDKQQQQQCLEQPASAIAPAGHAAADSINAAADSRLTRELDQVQQMRQELLSLLGGQGSLPAVDAVHEQQHDTAKHQQNGNKRPSDDHDANSAMVKRQYQQQQEQGSLPAGNAAVADTAPSSGQQYSQQIMNPALRPAGCDTISVSRAAAAGSTVRKRGHPRLPKRGRPKVPRCGACIPCCNPSDRRSCFVNKQRLAEGLAPLLSSGMTGSKSSAAGGTRKQHLSVAPVPVIPGRSASAGNISVDHVCWPTESDDTAGNVTDAAASPKSAEAAHVLANMLRSAAVSETLDSSRSPDLFDRQDIDVDDYAVAAAADVTGPTDPSNTQLCVLKTEQAAVGAMSATSEQPCIVDDVSPVMSVNGKEQTQPSEHAPPAAADSAAETAASSAMTALLQSLRKDLEALKPDSQGNLHSTDISRMQEAVQTVQLMEELRQQLAEGYEQTGQEYFATGLSVLWEILKRFQSLAAQASKVSLACNLLLTVPAAYCPDDQACSVLELLMCCWLKEVQDTGLSVAEGHVAAAMVEGLEAENSHVNLVSGLCFQTLLAATQLSGTHVLQANVSASAGKNVGDANTTVASIDSQQGVVHVVSGLSLLLMQWRGGPAGDAWHTALVRWRQRLGQVIGAAGDVDVMQALQDLEQCFEQLSSLVHQDKSQRSG